MRDRLAISFFAGLGVFFIAVVVVIIKIIIESGYDFGPMAVPILAGITTAVLVFLVDTFVGRR